MSAITTNIAAWRVWPGPIVIFACVVGSSLIGVATRPVGLLATFWPANALLAGLLIRRRDWVRWWTLPVSAAGYVLADTVTGDSLQLNLWLAAGNLVSAGAAVAVLGSRPLTDRQLRRPRAVVHLVAAGLLGGILSACLVAWPVSGSFDETVLDTWFIFVNAEFSNHLALLPLVLTVGLPTGRRRVAVSGEPAGNPLGAWVTVVALLIAAHAVAMLMPGPGSNAIPIPALLAAAVVLGLTPTAALALLSTAWTMMAIGHDWIRFESSPLSQQGLMSLQVGTSLIVLGPIAVAAAMQVRDEAFLQLRRRVAVDELTGALTRSTFHAQAGPLVDDHRRQSLPVALLMLDLDHFKRVNDTFGHLAGDEVLECVGRIIRRTVRTTDVFGRLGGEEFAVLLPGTSGADAHAIAVRLRNAVSTARFGLLDGAGVTVSIGVAELSAGSRTLDDLISGSDVALYRAKNLGRNRVYPAEPNSPEFGGTL